MAIESIFYQKFQNENSFSFSPNLVKSVKPPNPLSPNGSRKDQAFIIPPITNFYMKRNTIDGLHKQTQLISLNQARTQRYNIFQH